MKEDKNHPLSKRTLTFQTTNGEIDVELNKFSFSHEKIGIVYHESFKMSSQKKKISF